MSTLYAAASGAGLGTLYVQLTADASRLVTGMKQAEASMVSSSSIILKQATLMSAGVTAALVAIGTASVYQFGKFEESMLKATSIMGTVSASMQKELENTARQMARNSVTSADQLAEAYYYLTSAGLKVEQSQKALGAVNEFAIAGMMDMATATSLAMDAQSALGLRSEDAETNLKNLTYVTDSLSKANILANATIREFADALTNRAAAAMRSVNMPLEEGLAILAVFADRGIKGAHAGDQFNIALRDMQRVAIESGDVLKELGVTVYDSTGKLLPMVKIIKSMEEAFRGMSDEQKRSNFLRAGFQDRSLSAVLSLMETSTAMDGYRRQLKEVDGVTKQISDTMQTGINAQFTILKNNVVDLMIGLGAELAPVLKVFNAMFKETVQTQGQFTEATNLFTSSSAPALIKIIGTIGDIFSGWAMILKGVEIAFNVIGVIMTGSWMLALKAITTVMNTFVNGVVSGINLIITQANKLLPVAKQISKIDFQLALKTETVETYFEAFKQGVIESSGELQNMVDKGTFGDRLKAEWEKATKAVKVETAKQVEVKKVADEQVLMMEAQMLRQKTEMQALAWAEQKEKDRLMKEFDAIPTIKTGMGRVVRGGGSDPISGQLEAYEAEKQAALAHLKLMEEINQKDIQMGKERDEKKIQLMTEYGDRLKALQMAQAQLIIQSAQSIFDNMATMAGDLAGKQSGAYKVMFAASKAFAIANAGVQIATGLANAAAASPWFMAIPAMASVIAATASIVSSIQGIQMVNSGGTEARALGGPVSSGKPYLVGEKGPELFSPASNGHITPNNRLGGEGSVKVNVNNYTDATAKVTERNENGERVIEVMVARVKNEISSEVREGRGSINKSLETTFSLKRGQR